jgi:hypothetical protein
MRNEKNSIGLLYRLGGIVCIILIAYSLITMFIMVGIGTPPKSIEECFTMLKENRLHGLLRLDILTVFTMPLYYLLFYCIYLALKETDRGLAALSTVFVFVGLTLFLATPSVFSYLKLSDMFEVAKTEIEKQLLLAAGQAIFVSDMWNGTGARVGGLLLQLGALMISVVMLKSNVFTKFTAYTGIATHGLDLLHIIAGFFFPTVGIVLMAIAGPLYLVWFPLICKQLLKLSKQ